MTARRLRWSVARTRVGELSVGLVDERVGFVSLRAADGWERLERTARELTGEAPQEAPDDAAVGRAVEALVAYGEGELRTFDLPLTCVGEGALLGSPFERRVWEALLRIPFGATRTYGELARELGEPGATRAVGGAAGRNPVPLVVPCHRLLSADGLGGFTGERADKVKLLDHERRHALAGQSMLDFP